MIENVDYAGLHCDPLDFGGFGGLEWDFARFCRFCQLKTPIHITAVLPDLGAEAIPVW